MRNVGTRHRYVVHIIADCGCDCGADTSSARQENASVGDFDKRYIISRRLGKSIGRKKHKEQQA